MRRIALLVAIALVAFAKAEELNANVENGQLAEAKVEESSQASNENAGSELDMDMDHLDMMEDSTSFSE